MSTRTYLILKLHAPMASFGGAMVDSYGISRSYPALSMLSGLVGNALGYSRCDTENLTILQQALRYAFCLETPENQVYSQDFQTAELKKNDKQWTTRGTPIGRDGGAINGPHLRYRDYLHDLRSTAAITLSNATPTLTLDTIEAAFRHPERPLFIGRKPCIPSRPLFHTRCNATSAVSAIQQTYDNNESLKDFWWMDGEGPTKSHAAVSRQSICMTRDWRNGHHTGQLALSHAKLPIAEG